MDPIILDTLGTSVAIVACVAVALMGILALPWSDDELTASAGAFRTLALLPVWGWRRLRAARVPARALSHPTLTPPPLRAR